MKSNFKKDSFKTIFWSVNPPYGTLKSNFKQAFDGKPGV